MAIQLQTSDGQIFDTHEEIMKCSGTIKAMLDCTVSEGEHTVVPLPNVNSAILNKILQWANFHKDDKATLENAGNDVMTVRNHISSWDDDFLQMDRGMLFELIMAANYLDIQELLELTTDAVVYMIKGRTPEEIGKRLNKKNDVSVMTDHH